MAKKMSLANLTDCGLSGIGKIPYGAHFCHFYSKRQDLIDSLVPYFQAGLKNDERCLWIAADPLRAEEARVEIAQTMPSVEGMIKDGHIRIFDAREFFGGTKGNGSKGGTKGNGSEDLLGLWLAEEKKALGEGYQGLRIAGNMSFLSPQEWDTFMAFESTANQTFEGRRIVALCSYRLIQCQATDVFEVMRNHQLTLSRQEEGWEVLEKQFGAMSKSSAKASSLATPSSLVQAPRRR